MVVGLIVVGVIVFLFVDGLLIWRVIKGRRAADDLGVLPVPGSTKVLLEPGKVKITYTEARRARMDGCNIHFSIPDSVKVTVTSPNGNELEIKAPGIEGRGSSRSVGLRSSRDLVGTVEVTAPGMHTVAAEGDPGPEAVEPRILIGK